MGLHSFLYERTFEKQFKKPVGDVYFYFILSLAFQIIELIIALNGISRLENRERMWLGITKGEKNYYAAHHLEHLKNIPCIHLKKKDLDQNYK